MSAWKAPDVRPRYRRRTRAEFRIEQVANVNEADDVVSGIPNHRVTGVRRLDHFADCAVHGHVARKEVDLGPRHHHLAEAALTGRENVFHDPALLVAKSGRAAHHRTNLFVGHLLAGDLGSPPRIRTRTSVETPRARSPAARFAL